MPVDIEDKMAQIASFKPLHDLEFKYFELNHFSWWTSVKDKQGNELLPKICDYVYKHGYNLKYLRSDKGVHHIDSSWIVTFEMVKAFTPIAPNTLPNTYLKYYLYQDDIVKRANPNHTRTNEVMEGREKKVFEESQNHNDKYIK